MTGRMLRLVFSLFIAAPGSYAGDLILFPGSPKLISSLDRSKIEAISARLLDVFRAYDFAIPGGLASALASLEAMDPTAAVDLYARAFEIAVLPYAELGMQMAPEAAHAYAIEVVYRGSQGHVTYELENYHYLFEMMFRQNQLLIKHSSNAVMPISQLSELARGTARSREGRLLLESDDVPWPERRRLALNAWTRICSENAPPAARDYLLGLALDALEIEELADRIQAYELAFAYTRANDDPGAAHLHAEAMVMRHRTAGEIRNEIEARGRDLALRRATRDFLTKGIREGGLAMSLADAERTLDDWVNVFSQAKPIERFTSDYRMALGAFLAKDIRSGRPDEVHARERALELVRGNLPVEPWLRERGFRLVELDALDSVKPARGLRRLVSCAKDLFSRRR